MALIFVRPIARCAMVLLFVGALVPALPAGDCAAQSKAPGQTESAAPSQAAQDRPDTATKEGGSRAMNGTADTQDQDRRLVLLRLLVLGGGSYRPFGLFR
jgi:hypothetical protein